MIIATLKTQLTDNRYSIRIALLKNKLSRPGLEFKAKQSLLRELAKVEALQQETVARNKAVIRPDYLSHLPKIVSVEVTTLGKPFYHPAKKATEETYVFRSLATGWGKSHKSGGFLDSLTYEVGEGVRHTRCATLVGPKFATLGWEARQIGLVFAMDSVSKCFDQDCASYPTGRRQRSRKASRGYAKEVSLETLLREGSTDYPELFIKPGARPVALVISRDYVSREILDFAKEHSLEVRVI